MGASFPSRRKATFKIKPYSLFLAVSASATGIATAFVTTTTTTTTTTTVATRSKRGAAALVLLATRSSNMTTDGSHSLLIERNKSATALQLSPRPDQSIGEHDSVRNVTPTHDNHLVSLITSTTDDETTRRMATTEEVDDETDLLWREARYRKAAVAASGAAVVCKRLDYISWDDYFMAAAILSSHRSKDPSHASGACLVDPSNRIIGTGYNGFPAGCDDDLLPWHSSAPAAKTGGEAGGSSTTSCCWLHTKDPYVVPAEINAILNKCSADCSGARLYAQWFPGHECAKVIIQSGVSEIIYMDHAGDPDDDTYRASRILLSMANIQWRQYQPVDTSTTVTTIELDFEQALAKDHFGTPTSTVTTNQPVEDDPETDDDSDDDSPTRTGTAALRNLLIQEANYDPASMGPSKRTNYLSWDDYFLSMAFLTARRSKDPNTQVGACIVDSNKRIIGLGYNGFPTGCSDDVLPWARQGDSMLHTKYAYVVHAEVNAILNKGSANVQGATLYVALFPCNECAKIIIQAGIREVVFMSDYYHDTDSCRASRILFEMAAVRLRKHVPDRPRLQIDLTTERMTEKKNADAVTNMAK